MVWQIRIEAKLVAPFLLNNYGNGAMSSEAQNVGLSAEQMQLGIKLEGIFMPHSRKQRDEAYKSQTTPDGVQKSIRFVHYTSAEAALGIIQSKRIWMRNTTCMADYREVQHGLDMLNKFFSDKAKTDAFIAALDVCAPGAARKAIDLFNQWWNAIKLNTYIVSISEHDKKEDIHGRLSMWRAFGGNAARVGIVFDIPWSSIGAQALNIIFSPVAYLTEDETAALIHQIIANVGEHGDFLRSVDHQIIIANIFNMLLAGVTCLKHEGFREEREWRAIYCPKFRFSPLMESSTEIIGGVPQLVYKLPLDVTAAPALADLELSRIFDRLIIGPSPYPGVMHEAFVLALSNAGVTDAGSRVFASYIPIRA